MPFPGGTYLAQIIGSDNWVYRELDQHYALLQGWLSIEHDEDGHHTDITADSVDVEGDIASGGDGAFDGTVTADADGTPIVLEPDATLGPRIRLQNGSTSEWAISASASRTLSFRDVLETGDIAMLDIVRTGSSAYDVRPHSSPITLTLGTNSSGQRWSEVNATTVRADVLILRARSAPAQITSNQNNYAINGLGRVFVMLDAAHDLTGIVAGFDGELLTISNNSGFSLTVKHQDASSSAGNRLVCPDLTDYVLRRGGSMTVQYDTTTAVWWVMGA